MFAIRKILIFLSVNVLGFCTVGICYALGILSGVLAFSDPSFDTTGFSESFITGTIMTWVVCALFSFAYFFIKSQIRLVFLWTPVIIPFAYGLSVLLRFSL